MTPDVISTIVKKDLCSGCGLCAAMCPDHMLVMQFNRFGEYNPTRNKECEKDCGLCLKVCPFADGNDNEDSLGTTMYGGIPGICHRSETGYYLTCFVGFAPETRERGSSGGMATWLLSTLLKKGIVDHVITVIPNEDPGLLYKFSILDDPESVLASAGSAYYPVELSGILQEVKNKPGKYAIIGLPCFIKALRLATQRNRKLSDRIVITVGLVCGQLKNKHYTNYISALSGVIGPLQNVYYRGKSCEKPASIFYFSCMNKKGDTGKIFWDDGVEEAWDNRWFTLNACNYCDDVFAECADVTLMDAWLPEYFWNYQGTSLILVRSAEIQKIIGKGIEEKEINLEIIPIEKVIESQPGSIAEKGIVLAYRLFINKSAGFFTPQKRIKPVRIFNPFQKKRIILKHQMCISSKTIWADQSSKGSNDLTQFRQGMDLYLDQLTRWNRIFRVLTVPLQTFHYIQKIIRGSYYGKG